MYPPQTQSCFHTTIFLLPSTFSATHGQSAAIERCHMMKLKLWKFRLELNPVVTLGSSAIIWGLVIWCMVKPDEAKKQFSPWAAWITETWTWFYIGRNQNHYLTNSMGIFFFRQRILTNVLVVLGTRYYVKNFYHGKLCRVINLIKVHRLPQSFTVFCWLDLASVGS